MSNWRYQISTHTLTGPSGTTVSTDGWAGHGEGLNNVAMQDVKNVGPLPVGWYTFEEPHDSPHTGPYTMNLTPDAGNEMHDRGDFRCHGAAFEHPELSSDGCMIQPKPVRVNIWTSGNRRLEVIA